MTSAGSSGSDSRFVQSCKVHSRKFSVPSATPKPHQPGEICRGVTHTLFTQWQFSCIVTVSGRYVHSIQAVVGLCAWNSVAALVSLFLFCAFANFPL